MDASPKNRSVTGLHPTTQIALTLGRSYFRCLLLTACVVLLIGALFALSALSSPFSAFSLIGAGSPYEEASFSFWYYKLCTAPSTMRQLESPHDIEKGAVWTGGCIILSYSSINKDTFTNLTGLGDCGAVSDWRAAAGGIGLMSVLVPVVIALWLAVASCFGLTRLRPQPLSTQEKYGNLRTYIGYHLKNPFFIMAIILFFLTFLIIVASAITFSLHFRRFCDNDTKQWDMPGRGADVGSAPVLLVFAAMCLASSSLTLLFLVVPHYHYPASQSPKCELEQAGPHPIETRSSIATPFLGEGSDELLDRL